MRKKTKQIFLHYRKKPRKSGSRRMKERNVKCRMCPSLRLSAIIFPHTRDGHSYFPERWCRSEITNDLDHSEITNSLDRSEIKNDLDRSEITNDLDCSEKTIDLDRS